MRAPTKLSTEAKAEAAYRRLMAGGRNDPRCVERRTSQDGRDIARCVRAGLLRFSGWEATEAGERLYDEIQENQDAP